MGVAEVLAAGRAGVGGVVLTIGVARADGVAADLTMGRTAGFFFRSSSSNGSASMSQLSPASMSIGIRNAELLDAAPSFRGPPRRPAAAFGFVLDKRAASGSIRGGGACPLSNSSVHQAGQVLHRLRKLLRPHPNRRRHRSRPSDLLPSPLHRCHRCRTRLVLARTKKRA